jgi:alpha-D-xyloside xylohydrolase
MVEKRVIKVRFIGAGAKPVDFDAVDATVDYAGQPVVVSRKN